MAARRAAAADADVAVCLATHGTPDSTPRAV